MRIAHTIIYDRQLARLVSICHRDPYMSGVAVTQDVRYAFTQHRRQQLRLLLRQRTNQDRVCLDAGLDPRRRQDEVSVADLRRKIATVSP